MLHILPKAFLFSSLKEYLLIIVMILRTAGPFLLITPPLKSTKIRR